MTTTIEIKGLTQAQRLLDPARIAPLAASAMLESVEYVKGLVQERVPVDRGFARAGVVAEVRGTSVLADLRGVVGHAPTITYMGVLEEGRRPGRMPPRGPIEAWVVRHGMAASAWFVVARSIARRGIRGRHMFRDAALFAPGPLTGIWRRWMEKL